MMSSNKNDKEIIELIDTFFVKSTLLICSSKCNDLHLPETGEQGQGPQFDEEWFSSRLDDEWDIPEAIRPWSEFDGIQDLPPLVVETYLDLRQLAASQWLTLKDDDGNTWNVCKGTKKSEVVLERWLIELDRTSASFRSHKPTEEDSDNTPRQLVLLFRYLYTLIQLLPANDMYISLFKESESQATPSIIDVRTRVLDGSLPIMSKGRIGLSKPIISTYSNIINESNVPTHLEQRKITPVWTKFGLLRLSVSYRHDCHFKVQNPENDLTTDNHNRPELMLRNSSINRSLSLSPRAHVGSLNSNEQSASQRKPVSISRQFQVFKVGSVGSTPVPQSNTLTRNPSSSSSIVASLQAQRSSYGSGTGNFQPHQGPPQEAHIEGTSVGSGSKYASSFGKIQRRSSTKYTEQAEKINRSLKHSIAPSEDLLDFVRLIDQKPELQVRRNPVGNVDISSSLLKFQNLRPTNDYLSENLSLSMSIDPSHASQRRRSSSHSPIPSYSPIIKYPSIPSRLSRSRLNDGSIECEDNPHESHKIDAGSYNDNSISSERLGFSGKDETSFSRGIGNSSKDDEEPEDDDELLMSDNVINASKIRRFNSPRSVESASSSIAKNRPPIPQPSHYSQPTTIAVPAYAKLHRPGIKRDDKSEDNVHKNTNNDKSICEDQDDDEDLLFFMSDMNLSK